MFFNRNSKFYFYVSEFSSLQILTEYFSFFFNFMTRRKTKSCCLFCLRPLIDILWCWRILKKKRTLLIEIIMRIVLVDLIFPIKSTRENILRKLRYFFYRCLKENRPKEMNCWKLSKIIISSEKVKTDSNVLFYVFEIQYILVILKN